MKLRKNEVQKLFHDILDIVTEYFKKFFTSRIVFLCIGYLIMLSVLFVRLYDLQMINGTKYLEEYVRLAEKTVFKPATRGNIYDRNGHLLAYNKLAYAVAIQDNGEYKRVAERNFMLYKLVNILHQNNEEVIGSLMIGLDEEGNYYFTTSGEASYKRFLRDFYGLTSVDKLDDAEGKFPSDVDAKTLIDQKVELYKLDEIGNEEGELIILTPRQKLDLVNIRYTMSFTAYTKYKTTKVASDISEATKIEIQENAGELLGVEIEEEMLRQYNDSIYFSSIIGYTGKVQEEQLKELSSQNPNIRDEDTVGRIGIEEYMENDLHGVGGTQTIYVDIVGHIRQVISDTKSVAGRDVYLTIDRNLQMGIYHQLEQELAGILANKLSPLDEPNQEDTDSTERLIPIKDAYFQLINNNVLSISHFKKLDASENERNIYAKYNAYKETTFSAIRNELMSSSPQMISLLPEDQKAYMYYIYNKLSSEEVGIIKQDLMDKNADYYLRWKEDSISLRELLYTGISTNWIDSTKLALDSKYSDADNIFESLVDDTLLSLETDMEFEKLNYKYMIRSNIITGNELCVALYDQGILEPDPEEIMALEGNGVAYAFSFLVKKISDLKITPAQLALDPCTAGAVVTDVNTGEVLALVSYPGYDGNRLSNIMDADYYNQLLEDQSLPLYNNATQTRKAPGSTFKPIAAIAGLEEMVVGNHDVIECTGEYDIINPTIKCWIHPGKHGKLDVEGSIQNSCNYYFADIGHRLATKETGEYSTNLGIQRLQKYATMFGLDHKSGVEIPEYEPTISDVSPEQSAIGQGHHQYANVQLSRYVSALANRGKVFELSLLDKVVDKKGNVVKDYTPSLHSEVELAETTWSSVHTGMRRVIEHGSASRLFKDLEVNVAGKTGTAQETTSRGNHAFFISFGPYEHPEIAVTVNIPFGYSSSNAAAVSKDIYRLYFGYLTLEDIMSRTAVRITDVKIGD